ncbi:LmbE-like protein [Rhizopus microsporus var. microsporus]|uniref:N-acetylglucosaminylphosphatidylinositol deacetylase n=1 Tax=Rhizopus microsporus var. microsporus TaxID=86635 RepID=A0A1X0RCG6_RHIZD|nr:LmbE-like protein [Rhizopus microsporus var. microsporus]
MSDSTDNLSPGVKKQTRRFAPVKRGGGPSKPRASEPEVKSESTEQQKSTTIGTMRPESVTSGRLQSVNEGQKTRGGAVKMKFKPTVPLKRNKKEVTSSAIDEALNSKQKDDRFGRGRGGGFGRGGGRGRGRGRGRGLIIEEATASGIFSLGPSAVARSGTSRPGYGGGGFATYGGDVGNRAEADSTGTDMVEMFTEGATEYTPVTFPHVSRLEGDVDPITLSQKVGKIPWMTVRSKKEENDDNVKVKEEQEDGMAIDEQKEEVKTEHKEKVYMNSDAPAQNIFALDEKDRLVCVAEEELLYFQLPTVVPKFEAKKQEVEEIKDEEAVKVEKTEQNLPSGTRKSTLEDAMASLALEDMPEGQVGKLIVYKSGKMKMQFGNILLDITQGMHSSFLENVMVVDHESEETKKAIELGHIFQKSKSLPFKQQNRVLVVTAHPDDECMFFGPTITTLVSLVKCRVHVLCLSNGNAQGLGQLRKKELVRSCQTLGVHPGDVKCINDPTLQDSMEVTWDPVTISNHIQHYVTKEKIDTIITFDGYGVSGHTNHRAAYLGTKKFTDSNSSIRLYTLTSIPIYRKYIGIMDLWTPKKEELRLISPPISYLVTHKAMRQHQTQLVWFRWLYVTFSRYMFINGLYQLQ